MLFRSTFRNQLHFLRTSKCLERKFEADFAKSLQTESFELPYIQLLWKTHFKLPEKLFRENFVQAQLPSHFSSRSRVFYKEQLKQEAYGDYEIENHKKAIPKLEELYFQYKDTLSLYFLAISQLAVNQPDQAIKNFEKFEQLDYQDIRYQDTYYYIALAYIRKKVYHKALDVLENQPSPKAQKLKNNIHPKLNQKIFLVKYKKPLLITYLGHYYW